jgi:preprotein translocase subunit SecE
MGCGFKVPGSEFVEGVRSNDVQPGTRNAEHGIGLMADKIKLAAALILVAAGVAGFYYLDQSALIIRVAAVLAGLGAAAAVFWSSEPGRQFHVFAQEAAVETRKVVWPTRKETLQTTGIVFAFVVVMALFLWMVDASLLWVVKRLLGQSG